MKTNPLLILLALFSVSNAYVDPVQQTVNPKSVITIKELSKNMLITEDPSPDPRVPFFSSNGELAFSIREEHELLRLAIFSDGDHIRFRDELEGTIPFGSWYPAITPGWMVISGNIRFTAIQANGVFRIINCDKEESENYVFALGSCVFFRNYDSNEYSAYLLGQNATFERMNHFETLVYVTKNVPELEVRENVIYFKGNPLTSGFNQSDDDGNFYDGATMYSKDRPMITVLCELVNVKYLPSFFDNEGNYWVLDFTKDAAQHPILLYAGRDWGYKEAPKKAKTTAAATIRLRASADGFELGKLKAGEAITVLKTGAMATIGGKAAPWYRIKATDGMIGWVWGGNVTVVTK